MTAHFEPANPDYQAAVRDSFARQGLMATLGARIVDLGPGFCVIEMRYMPSVLQQEGAFHTGAIAAIADAAAGCAAQSLMPAGSEIRTVEFKLNFIAPALPPTLRAQGRVLRTGRTLTMCRAEIFHGGDQACALLQSTVIRSGGGAPRPLE